MLTYSWWVVGSASWLGAVVLSRLYVYTISPAVAIDSILQESHRGAGIDMDSTSIVGHFISTDTSVGSCFYLLSFVCVGHGCWILSNVGLILILFLLLWGCDSRNPADMKLPLKKHCAAMSICFLNAWKRLRLLVLNDSSP
eukprot:scaffold12182_cov119-Cylindrotheca_fusiformis.AAC.2